jgi:hypothetical protein
MCLLAFLVIVLGWDGNRLVFDRAEEAGRDVVATSGQVGIHAESCGGSVDFGSHLRPFAGGRECVHDWIGWGRDFRVRFQVVGQRPEPANKCSAYGGIGMVHQTSPLRIDAGMKSDRLFRLWYFHA